MKKSSCIAYLAVVALLCLAPSLGLLFGGAEATPREDAAKAPELLGQDGAPNIRVMSDAGEWFEDHFAYRNEWVTAAARLASLFGGGGGDMPSGGGAPQPRMPFGGGGFRSQQSAQQAAQQKKRLEQKKQAKKSRQRNRKK